MREREIEWTELMRWAKADDGAAYRHNCAVHLSWCSIGATALALVKTGLVVFTSA